MTDSLPDFKIWTELPSDIKPDAIDAAVQSFTRDSHCEDDQVGLYNQTIEGIAQTLIFKAPGSFFWAASENGNVVAYAKTHIVKDVDNRLCYYMTQAWVDKKYRNTGFARICYEKLRTHAKQMMCSHIIVVSSRNNKAYMRFLGRKWHKYVTLLKEDI